MDAPTTTTAATRCRPRVPFFDLPAEVRNMIYQHLVSDFCHFWAVTYLTSLPGHFFASARMRDEVLSMLMSRIIWRIDIYSADDFRDNMRRIRCTGDIAMTFVERAWVDILRPETGCWESFPIDLKEDGPQLYQSDKPGWIWQRCGLLFRPRRIKLARLASEELNGLKRRNVLTAELWAHTLQTLYELYDDDDDELCDGGSERSES